jgi:hypothetical protein
MNLGATLKAAEKVFGPALPGRGSEEKTLAAIRYAKGGAKKFAGVIGFQEDAKFHIHFPTAIDWSLLTTKRGTPDFVSDLKESGPQGEQGREALVAAFMEKYEGIQTKLRAKRRKSELAQLRGKIAPYAGEREATFSIGSESFSLPVKITVDKTGKVKIVAAL